MAAFLSPLFGAGWQIFSNTGIVLSGGKIHTYVAGSVNTPQATWTTSTQTTQNANPIILDSAGRPPDEIWLSSSAYKLVLTDSLDNVLGSWDFVSGINNVSSTQTEWLTSGLTPSFVSATQFTVSGNQTSTFTVNRRIQYRLGSGTFYGYVSSSTFDGVSTTTVTIVADSTALDNSLFEVNYSFLSAVNISVPENIISGATQKPFFDTLYVGLTGNQTIAGQKSFSTGATILGANPLTLQNAAANDVVTLYNSGSTGNSIAAFRHGGVDVLTVSPSLGLGVAGNVSVPDASVLAFGAGTTSVAGSSAAQYVNLTVNSVVRGQATNTGFGVNGTLSATDDLTLSKTNATLFGGATAGSGQLGNSNASAYFKAYGPTHATKPGQTEISGVLSVLNNTTINGNLNVTGTISGAGASSFGIMPISASVGSNALTLTLNASTLTFRSATLGDGTVNGRTVSSPISVIVPSGATLGTVSGVQSRLVVIAIDNAGTVELAVVNLAGGTNLDETTLLTTTTISAGASSASTAYSTTGRSNVPFRVVGYVESTQATAGTWATAPSTIQGFGGQAVAAMSSIGYGQTWQNFSVGSTRVYGTTYYNTTGRPIQVVYGATNVAGTSITVVVNGVTIFSMSESSQSAIAGQTASFIVPPSASYSISASGTPSSPYWNELR